MKILYHHRVASRDGQFVHIEAIINVLKAQGHEVIVVAPKISEQTEFGDNGGWVSTLRQRLPGAIAELMEFGYCFYDFLLLARAIKKHQPDAIYERYNLFLPSGIWAKKLFTLPLLLEVNSPLYQERHDYTGIHLPMLAKWSEYYTWRNADHVLPVSHVLAEFIYEAGVSTEQVTVIPNGIDPAHFNTHTQPERMAQFRGKTVLGFVGFCREWHQLDKVMARIASLNDPDIHLLIIGDGPVLDELRATAKQLKITAQTHITGLIPREKMPCWLAQIDIALQPAVTPWCSPLKLIEYLASGKAIVAPNAPNIKELVNDQHNALLFQNGDMDNMLHAIERLIHDTALRQRLQCNASQTIDEKQLTWQGNGEKIIQLFTQISTEKQLTTKPI
ncbi:glycosyltransferase family 1 protein [Photobacterium gaetbulicola]|uniref:Putative glycosyl transferase, group 1 n=1 Tax=Photobacterium gaetbulicola Gung47 TaxID=658445 RepID=A0A0C5WRR2_9GAMM|nr:glycosyltransferase family 4 protein [Photobacterium gaetbulicola]AJR09057.1 putative glycosyl transferase, group 1 [Photobacterium gaetbulicola Gung47]PSU04823.1 glycosyltransferase family 1 protein [Photobacterium gaetbulicola]